jgi:uncharacterized protein (TIGR01777 family)
MAERRFSTPLPFPPGLVRAWHERPGAFQRLAPPWEAIEVLEQQGTVREGDRLVMRIPPGVQWEAVHHPLPDGFVDEMARGPFSSWRHAHHFVDDGAGGTVIHDEITFAPDLAAPVVDARLARMFAFRRARLQEDLSRHAGRPPLRVLLAGASGLLGTQLVALLQTGGHEVVQLVRRTPGPGQVRWDPAAGELDPTALEGVDALISLSGENVGEGAWTPARKDALLQSRLQTTSLLSRTLAACRNPPRTWLSASAVGYYGDTGDTGVDETGPRGGGFLAELCERWEAAAVAPSGVRRVLLRLGVVLSARGGALARMASVFRFGAGGPIGGGRQFFPWIAMDDALYAMLHALHDPSLAGPVNLVAPNETRQAEFAGALGRAVGRPAFLPLPAALVRTLFGQMGEEVLLAGQRVRPAALAPGFRWSQPDLDGCLRWELGAGGAESAS